jgi:hypothetical protein
MLLPYTTLIYYGPATGACIVDGEGDIDAEAKGTISGAALLDGEGSIPLAKSTRLISAPVLIEGEGSIPAATSKGRLRSAAEIGITDLGQAEVTGAVMEAEIYPGISLKQALRGILSAQGGKVGINGNTVTIRDPADTKNVITATTDAEGRRTAVTLDLS